MSKNLIDKDHCMEDGINWMWFWYSTKEVAERVLEACRLTNPNTTMDTEVTKGFNDGCPTYRGEPMWGFRVHK